MKRFYLLFFVLIGSHLTFATPMPWGNGQSKPENLQFYLVTFGPGDDIPSYWGHIAMIVEDTLLHQSAIYNYGLYSFDNDFLWRFVQGRLIFEVGRASVNSYFRYYRSQNRTIQLLRLHIPLSKRLQLAGKLEWNILPQNKKYLYHHYYDNCSTRLRDLLDQALDGKFHQAMKTPASMTLRDHTKRYVGRNPLLEWVLMFLMSDRIDRPINHWDEMFLPDELQKYAQQFHFTNSSGKVIPLAEPPTIIFKATQRPPVPDKIPRHEIPALLLGILMGGMVLGMSWQQKRKPFRWFILSFSVYQFLVGLMWAILGGALFFLMFFTEHDVTYGNENILLALPIMVFTPLLAVFLAREKKWAFRVLKYLWGIQLLATVLLIVLKFLWPTTFDQDNMLALCFMTPMTVSLSLSFLLVPETLFIGKNA